MALTPGGPGFLSYHKIENETEIIGSDMELVKYLGEATNFKIK